MTQTESLNTISLIAPCGLNCELCMAYQREKNRCSGCRGSDEDKRVSCLRCVIITCRKPRREFCFECDEFPCRRLKNLDKRYRTKYRMSMIENLMFIKTSGIGMFLENEKARWTCKNCGGTICVHRGICFACGTKW
jgi:hypothetical protein